MSETTSIDPKALRQALGYFATGVTVVTTRTPQGHPIGVTMNSFSSVSLDPPLILFSLSRISDQFDSFMAAKHFAVNVLAEHQEHISNRQSASEDKVISEDEFETWVTGSPILHGSIAAFDCIVRERHEGGDHIIFLCEVLKAEAKDETPPLIFHKSRYASLARPAD